MRDEPVQRDEIIGALARIEGQMAHLRNGGRTQFVSDDVSAQVAQLAACQLVIQLQAALDDLPAAFLLENPDLPFHQVRGMRNRLAHGYGDLDAALLWSTIDSALPAFLTALGARLRAG